mgnify:CR=1 FL=1
MGSGGRPGSEDVRDASGRPHGRSGIQNIEIEDKSFLHKKHKGNQEGKFHLKLNIVSDELKNMSRIESNKKIYKILDKELKEFIHSIQILIS